MSNTSTFVVFEHYKLSNCGAVESFVSKAEAEAYIKDRFEHDFSIDYKTTFTIEEVEVE